LSFHSEAVALPLHTFPTSTHEPSISVFIRPDPRYALSSSNHPNSAILVQASIMTITPPDHTEALRRERRSQLRGLLLLAGAVLTFLLIRARPLHLFHPNWWRP
jgi:hypothetical protein